MKVMFQALHASSKLEELNNDTLCIDNVLSILITVYGNVFIELLLVDNLDGHFGQLQGMQLFCFEWRS
jgi:hypothetical protein